MEVYDKNVADWGLKPIIENIQDAKAIHNRMIQLDIKMALGIPFSMPHYRGEQKFGWDILPNINRLSTTAGDKDLAKRLEKRGWEEFGSVISKEFGPDALRTIFDNEKHGRDWNLIMQAQHAGVKTSLLDWSPEIYAALYFATEESKDVNIENSDGQFWVYLTSYNNLKNHSDFPVRDTYYDQDPQSVDNSTMINVSILLDDLSKRKYETRMYHQKGRFFVSSNDNWGKPMNYQPELTPFLFRFCVPAQCKPIIRDLLEKERLNYNYFYGPYNPDHQALIDNINKRIFQV